MTGIGDHVNGDLQSDAAPQFHQHSENRTLFISLEYLTTYNY